MPNDLFDCDFDIWPEKNKLLSCLYKSKKLNDSIRNLSKKNHVGKELSQELKSELFLILCEKNEIDLFEIYANGYFDYFVIKILTNLIKGVRNKFQRTIRMEIQNRSNSDTFDPEDKPEGSSYDAKQIETLVQKLNWFQREVIHLYTETKSFPKVAEITGVSRIYAEQVMSSARKDLKKLLDAKLV